MAFRFDTAIRIFRLFLSVMALVAAMPAAGFAANASIGFSGTVPQRDRPVELAWPEPVLVMADQAALPLPGFLAAGKAITVHSGANGTAVGFGVLRTSKSGRAVVVDVTGRDRADFRVCANGAVNPSGCVRYTVIRFD